jgi:hypothetical protein
VSFAAGDKLSLQASGVSGAKPVLWTVEYH